MKFVKQKQAFAIAGAVLLTVLLYVLPTQPSGSVAASVTKPETRIPTNNYNFKAALQKAKSQLNADSLKKINQLEGRLKPADTGNNVLLITIANYWDLQKQPGIAAHYFELIAQKNPDEGNWLNPAYRYFDAFKMEANPAERAALVEKAIDCYSKVTEINAHNLDAKTDLGICYTETPQPMKGITLLREVISEKPTHENAQYNLGLLSMKSRQFDKAVDRFQKVIQINSGNMDAYLYLGEAFVEKNEKLKAIEAFEKYNHLCKNEAAKKQVNTYIEKLKNN
jgi:tetratricopeptide (TPR) repeat protein